MTDYHLSNGATGTRVTMRVYEGGFTLFITPRKHSQYSIPVRPSKEVYKEIKKELKKR